LAHDPSRATQATPTEPSAVETPDKPPTLRTRTLSGLKWRGATQALGQVFQFGVSIVIARLLSPDDLGLMGMIVVVTGFAATIADLGLGNSIIQQQGVSDRQLQTVFWLVLGLGAVLCVLFALTVPWVAHLYHEPQLGPVTDAVATTFVIVALAVVPNALLEKGLDFRARFQIEAAAIAVSGSVAVAMALAGEGIWSLVAQLITAALARTTTAYVYSSWRPRMVFDGGSIKELLVFGRSMVGFNCVVYWAQNFDKLMVGRTLGAAALGVYRLADQLMRMPLTNVTNITTSVMFPALSSLGDDIATLRRVYLRANRMIALLTFPLMLGLGVLSEPAILTIYGEKWRGAIAVVEVLCLAGMAQSVYNTATWIFLSRKRPDILFRLGVLSAVVRIAGVLIGMNWGVLGIALAYTAGGFVGVMLPTWIAAGQLVGLRLGELLRNVAAPLGCALAMAVTLAFADHELFDGQEPWLRLVALVPLGAGFYVTLIRVLDLQAWTEVREVLLDMGGQRSPVLRWLLGADAAAKKP